MMKRCLGVLAVTLAGLVACSSDDDDDGGSNSAACFFSACGGNPVGSWTVQETCSSGLSDYDEAISEDAPSCEGSTKSFEILNNTLSLEIRAGGGYISSGRATVAIRSVFSENCLAELADRSIEVNQDYCDAIETTQRESECTLSGSSCDCSYEAEVPFGDAGTYELDGSSISSRGADGQLDNGEFCVDDDGSTLKIRSSEGNVTVYRSG